MQWIDCRRQRTVIVSGAHYRRLVLRRCVGDSHCVSALEFGVVGRKFQYVHPWLGEGDRGRRKGYIHEVWNPRSTYQRPTNRERSGGREAIIINAALQ